jgi:hypothetical protein
MMNGIFGNRFAYTLWLKVVGRLGDPEGVGAIAYGNAQR